MNDKPVVETRQDPADLKIVNHVYDTLARDEEAAWVRIIVCVDMFGERFDPSSLKIAGLMTGRQARRSCFSPRAGSR